MEFMKSMTRLVPGLLLAAVSSLASAADNAPLSLSGNFEHREGKVLFQAICQGCHMSDAKGAQGAGTYPALAGNARLASAVYPVHVVTNGQGGMPSFKEYLDDEQIVEVVNYVRTHFGNQYEDKVTLEIVKSVTQR